MGREAFVMSPLLCKSLFIRDINHEVRALIDDRCTGKQSPPIGFVQASSKNQILMYHKLARMLLGHNL